MSESKHIAVIGAGIAGLATTIGLRQLGMRVAIFERAAERDPHGGALLLWPNAIKAVRHLGLEDVITAAGTRIVSTEFRTWSNALLWELPIKRLEEQYGAPTILVSRGVLARILEEAALNAAGPPPTLCYGVGCDGFRLRGDHVIPALATGATESSAALPFAYDALLGCDGIGSTIRAQLFGAAPRRSAYNTAWIGITTVPTTAWDYPAGHTVTFLGGGLRFCAATMSDDDGRRVYWYATEALSNRSHDGFISPQRLVETFAPYSARVADLIAATTEVPYPTPFSIADRPPLRGWSRGHVALMGDAVHSCTPDLGQGACQALESAVVMRYALEQHRSIPRAFAWFERRRSARAARVTHASRLTSIQSMVTGPGVDLVRNGAIRLFLPGIALTEYHTLFGVDFP